MHSSAPPPAPLPAQRFALLVGVNEYRAFDQATKTAMGMYDLRAPRNDVIAWFKFLRRMDVPAANIRVLTTPALTPEELDTDDEVICGEATTANMQDAAKWYIDVSDRHGPRGYGFVFLAGHGDFSSTMGYALFLADYKGTPVGNILKDTATEAGVAQLMWLLGLYGRRSPTTVVADVCRRSSVVIPATTANPPIDVDSVSTSDLVQVIEATGPGMASYERCFEGTWRGQFTWAAMSILRNWPTRRLSDRTPYVAIPAALLQQKIQTLLSVFNNPTQSQTPTLYQTMEAPKGSIPGPFMLPGVPARVYEFASDGLGHEFPAGATDFKDT
ncbi:MAG TPA: caspase family protein, partial [Myxococcota bacterium]|nr:caspase family protein [Myxococcota bacterium]